MAAAAVAPCLSPLLLAGSHAGLCAAIVWRPAPQSVQPGPSATARLRAPPRATHAYTYAFTPALLQADREAMVSATIHLANRDWDALIDDFVALGFLPAGCDRGASCSERCGVPSLRRETCTRDASALCSPALCCCCGAPIGAPPYRRGAGVPLPACSSVGLPPFCQAQRTSRPSHAPHRPLPPCLALQAGLIIPVMDRVLGPYLRGGGAKAFKSNFQALSTDLLVGEEGGKGCQ